jgi:hypothetical protein
VIERVGCGSVHAVSCHRGGYDKMDW